MRKVLVIGIAALACLALASGNMYACGGEKTSNTSAKSACSASKTTAKLASAKETEGTAAKSGCAYSKGTTATAAKSGCPHSMGTAATAQMTAEEHVKQCNYEGKCEYTAVSIKGMTCGGCERTVKTALTNVPGVIKVCHVSYKEGMAGVCFDPTKTNTEALTKAVAGKGYEATIVPAVAKTSDMEAQAELTGVKASCSDMKTKETKTKSVAEGTH